MESTERVWIHDILWEVPKVVGGTGYRGGKMCGGMYGI